jgi:hypothetical protein
MIYFYHLYSQGATAKNNYDSLSVNFHQAISEIFKLIQV